MSVEDASAAFRAWIAMKTLDIKRTFTRMDKDQSADIDKAELKSGLQELNDGEEVSAGAR